MSLKNLVKQAKRGRINTDNLAAGDTAQALAGITYDLNLRTPTGTQISASFGPILASIAANGGELSEANEKALILLCYRIAFSQNSRANGYFHPSEISNETNICSRKMYFQRGKVEKDDTYVNFTSDNQKMRLVDLGTLLHLYTQENLERSGILTDFETIVHSEEYGIKGKMDGLISFVGYDDYGQYYDKEIMGLEFKSINEFGFKALRRPKPEHLKQASIYGYFSNLKRMVFLYYNKNNSELKIYVENVDVAYVESFKLLGGSIVKAYDKNRRKHRTTDVEKHVDIPKKVCRNRTVVRAMECAFADYCFKHKTP